MKELRDHSLTGAEAQNAVQNGFAQAQWYSCAIGRPEMKALMRRRNWPGIRDTLIWFGGMVLCGVLAFHFLGCWAAVPCFWLYGVLYGGASDSRWHECVHGTAFKTDWMNEALHLLACLMMLREPTVWRWSHARHHTDTLIVGRDPEISNPRPTNFFRLFLDFSAVRTTSPTLYQLIVHSCGQLTAVDRCSIPPGERRKVVREARIGSLLLASVIGACMAVGSILPALFVGLPTLYGSAFGVFVVTAQHAGLAEDVLDHRLNSRTVYMNLVFRFRYWNMNYHLQHHLFPMVPFHALPRLHAVAKPYLLAPYASCVAANREIIPALLRQRKDIKYFVRRPLPQSLATETQQRLAAVLDSPVVLNA